MRVASAIVKVHPTGMRGTIFPKLIVPAAILMVALAVVPVAGQKISQLLSADHKSAPTAHKSADGGGTLPSYLGPVAARTGLPNADGGPTNIQFMAQSQHPLLDDIRYLEVWWAPTWRVDPSTGQEVTKGVASTCRASVTFTDASGSRTTTRLKEIGTGKDMATSPDGGYCKMAAPVVASRGQRILLRVWGNSPRGIVYLQQVADYANGDVLKYGMTTPDLTGTTTSFTDTYQGDRDAILPALILGHTKRRTVTIIGDSRDVGIQDVADDGFGCVGQIARLLCPYVGVTNLSTVGNMASGVANPAFSARRMALARYSSDLMIGLGVNDTIAQGASAATTYAHIESIAKTIGKPAIFKTIDPWVANANMAIYSAANDEKRQALNALLRQKPVYDITAVMENPAHLYTQADFVSADGVHESNKGNAHATTAAHFDWELLGKPSPIPAPAN